MLRFTDDDTLNRALAALGQGFLDPSDDDRLTLQAIETLRGLLMGDAIGNSAYQSIAWSVGITLVGFLWSMKLFSRDPSR